MKALKSAHLRKATDFTGERQFPEFQKSGKVRDIWTYEDYVLLIATDRISAFDVVMPSLIPGKGTILTSISERWFSFFSQVPNHLRVIKYPDFHHVFFDVFTEPVENRTSVGIKTNVIPIEFVVRGYMAGSLWKEYEREYARMDPYLKFSRGSPVYVHGIPLPPGLKQCEELPESIFTPATKALSGEHDENITFDKAVEICAKHLKFSDAAALQLMKNLRSLSIRIYNEARCFAITKGIIIADTKFEFGYCNDTVLLIDELLTPDSSRFWDLKTYDIGRDQDSFDKQILRNHLEDLVSKGLWDKSYPAPQLPDNIVEKIRDRYEEVYKRLWSVV